MKIKSKIKKIIKNPLYLIVFFNNRGITLIKDDEKYIRFHYRLRMNEKLNLDNPKNFNEKIQWLKLNNRKDIYVSMVDKYAAKKYVSNIIGDEYIIKNLGVYNKFEEINFDELPEQFVIKSTHDSGGIVICKDKKNLDIKSAKKKINKSLKRKFYLSGREWPYKNVVPRIIIESFMCDSNKDELIDYKFFCFNGEPKMILTCSERFSSNNMCKTFFDNNWNVLPITENKHRIDKSIKRPINFDKMLEFSKKLAVNIPFVRIDWYEVNKKLYFGEITFFPNSGFEKFEPEEWNEKLGSWINLED